MFLNDEEDYFKLSLSKFETMLKSNKVFFFDSEEFENIILHYVDSGRLNLANKALKLALEQHPLSTDLKLVKVEVLLLEDKIEQAQKLLNEIKLVDALNEEVYIQQANIYSKKNLHVKAVESLNIALQYTDDFADVYSLIGMEYLYMEQLEEARYYFKKCIEHDPEDQSALYNIVYCFDFLNQPVQAISFLEKFIDDYPYSEVAWHQLGRQYFNIQDYNKAVQAFDFAIVIDENFLGAILEKAKSYERLKKFKKAIECYKETLTIDPNSAYVLWRIGSSYESLNNNKKALKYFLRSVYEDPMLDKAWSSISDLYIKIGNFEKALYYINKALALDATNKSYWTRFAIVSKELLRFSDAIEGFEKAIENGDVFIDTWLFLSQCYQTQNQMTEAIERLEYAKEVFPEENEILYRLAGLYFINNDFSQGQNYLNQALKVNIQQLETFKLLFPELCQIAEVQQIIASFNN